MHWMNKLERKIGKYAIKHLIIYILGAYVIGYVFYFMDRFNIMPGLYSLLEMNPAMICRGQVWRLVTWVCTMPQNPGIFLIFMFILYYWLGNTLYVYGYYSDDTCTDGDLSGYGVNWRV